MPEHDDAYWMHKAMAMAEKAREIGEVPVGAVIVKNNEIISSGYNHVIINNDPTAHAEVQAIRNAGAQLNNYRLVDTKLYVTLEPCMMCVGAIVHARISQVVFGAYDPKTGMAGTQDNCFEKSYHNHQVDIKGGILEKECAHQLTSFFKQKRLKK